jgi:predicted transcriptional regulator
MMILYTDANNNKLIDFNTLQTILKTNKSKLYRALNQLPNVKVIKYKNQFLYQEKTLFELMKLELIKRLEKMAE